MSDLPPGVRDSDIPGNRPIDIVQDRIIEEAVQRWESDTITIRRAIEDAMQGYIDPRESSRQIESGIDELYEILLDSWVDDIRMDDMYSRLVDLLIDLFVERKLTYAQTFNLVVEGWYGRETPSEHDQYKIWEVARYLANKRRTLEEYND